MASKAPTDLVRVAFDVPRALLQIVETPVLVSQRSSDRVLGLSPGVFLGLLRAFERDGGTVLREGKARLVRVEPFVTWLGARSKAAPSVDAGEPDDVDNYSRELGLVARGRR